MAQASNDIQKERFQILFNSIAGKMKYSTGAEVADALLVGKSRVTAFNIQALGKIYANRHKNFKKLKEDFKSLEDGIGEYKKWRDLLAEAEARNASVSKIKKFRKKKEEAKVALSNMLEDKNWIKGKRIKRYQKFISKFDFGGHKKDRDFVLKTLEKYLEKISKTEFDMHVLEEGNGVHELRREIRWFLMEAKVLNGTLYFRKNTQACPIEQYQNLPQRPIASSKYATINLSPLEKNPCLISQCLFLALVKKVGEYGDLKDQIEADLNLQDVLTDETPEKYKPTLEKLYHELKNSQVLDVLADEIYSCR